MVFLHLFFSLISCAEVLNLILDFLECTYSLYTHIQCLVVELNSNTLTLFITYMCFVMISCWVPHISSFRLWSILHKDTFVIRFYTLSTCIHLYVSFLIWNLWCRELTQNIIISVCHSHPVCVSIHAHVIFSAHVHRKYWNIYDKYILFLFIYQITSYQLLSKLMSILIPYV